MVDSDYYFGTFSLILHILKILPNLNLTFCFLCLVKNCTTGIMPDFISHSEMARFLF